MVKKLGLRGAAALHAALQRNRTGEEIPACLHLLISDGGSGYGAEPSQMRLAQRRWLGQDARMSWRDQISQVAQDDLDGLLDAVLPFGQKMLDRHGEFFPYGATVSVGGEMRMLAAAAEGERPASDGLLDTLYSSARSTSALIRAAAFVSAVRLGESAHGGAIRIELEHQEGASLVVLLPYRLDRGAIEYGDLSAQAGDHRVWDR